MHDLRYLTVTELNQQIKFLLEDSFFHCLVEGEISNVIKAQSGHIYFNLKDENSVIRTVLWRSTAMQFSELIENGAQVEIQGKLSLYVPRGDYQLIVSRIAPRGRGDLYLAFEKLKEKLQKEGMFEPEHKQKIPKYPKKIGIVTSPNAAALQDVLRTLAEHRQDIPYKVYPTLVQGDSAPDQITKAIELANLEKQCDLLLVVRGGGSIEDLWCFNDETVVRAIYTSQIPIITGIGHEIDTTLSDFAADLRAPTPTGAAKLAGISQQELTQQLDHYQERLTQLIKHQLERYTKQLNERILKLSYLHPLNQIKEKREYLQAQEQRLLIVIKHIYNRYSERINHIEKRLIPDILTRKYKLLIEQLERQSHALSKAMNNQHKTLEEKLQQKALLLDNLSPLKVLGRGYSITHKLEGNKATPLSSIKQLTIGDEITTQLGDGKAVSVVSNFNCRE